MTITWQRTAAALATLRLVSATWAQTPSQTPRVDNRAPGTAASDVSPGAPSTGVRKDGSRSHGADGAAMNQGASSAQTYDYPASAPKAAPSKRP